jgi:hypothetical protein
MNRINALRNIAETRSLAWGRTAGPLVFAAVLIICSVTVGCSSSNNSEKPKPVSSTHQIPVTQPQSSLVPVSSGMPAENKPAPKKVVHKKPATVNYTDKTYGVTFEYPRRYAIETGNAAAELLTSSPVPMNFVQPGGVALAAVELPETSFANTDFSSAFFNVSVHKAITAEQCNEFAVPMPKVDESKLDAKLDVQSEAKPEVNSEAKVEAPTEVKPEAKPEAGSATPAASTEAATAAATPAPAEAVKAASEAQPAQPATMQPAATTEQPAVKPSTDSVAATEPASNSKLLLGDMELRATEAVSGEGTRQSDSKYFHIYQNGACYEFALNVTTVASSDGLIKHVDRDKVFSRLEKILDTVKINPLTPEATAETPATPAASGNPAQ